MNIDIHAHYFPASAVKACATGDEWFGTGFTVDSLGVPIATTYGKPFRMGSADHLKPIEFRLEQMARLSIDMQVLSLLPPLFRYGLDPATGLAASRAVNDELAGIVEKWPTRFGAMATVPMQDVDMAIEELRRSREELGLVGVSLGSNIDGRNLDSQGLFAFFEAAQDLETLILVHPVHPRDRDSLSRYYLRNVIGNPWETTIAASSLVLSGVLDDLPDLRVCLAHAGGYLPFASGRLDRAYAVRPEVREKAAAIPSSYLPRFFYDSITHSRTGLRFLVDAVGADNVVLGTDFPADMGKLDAVADISDNSLLSAEEKRAVLGANIERLLGLTGG